MLDLEAGGPEITGSLSYNEGLFSHETISRMADHLVVLLRSIAANSAAPISHLTFIQPSERELVRLLHATCYFTNAFADTAASKPCFQT